MNNEEFYIGQIFEGKYPPAAAVWCNRNKAFIEEIEPVDKEVEETYIEIVPTEQEQVIPAEYDENGEVVVEEHTETIVIDVPEERTRTVEKTFRRYEIQAMPEPTEEEKQAAVRAIRDNYIRDIEWRVSRYRDQAEMQIETTDTEETYHKILQYMQYLRDYPESSATWYEQNPMTFEEWQTSQD